MLDTGTAAKRRALIAIVGRLLASRPADRRMRRRRLPGGRARQPRLVDPLQTPADARRHRRLRDAAGAHAPTAPTSRSRRRTPSSWRRRRRRSASTSRSPRSARCGTSAATTPTRRQPGVRDRVQRQHRGRRRQNGGADQLLQKRLLGAGIEHLDHLPRP